MPKFTNIICPAVILGTRTISKNVKMQIPRNPGTLLELLRLLVLILLPLMGGPPFELPTYAKILNPSTPSLLYLCFSGFEVLGCGGPRKSSGFSGVEKLAVRPPVVCRRMVVETVCLIR